MFTKTAAPIHSLQNLNHGNICNDELDIASSLVRGFVMIDLAQSRPVDPAHAFFYKQRFLQATQPQCCGVA